MSSVSTPFVVGISGPSGAGKTAVVLRLKDLIPDSVAIFFDEYDEDTVHPESFRDWLVQGADYNAWKTPRLAADLGALKEWKDIQHPLDGRPIPPRKMVIFDAPLGYAHEETGSLIDYMVYVDTPLDVAMARRLLRDGASSGFSVQDEMEAYLDYGKQAYLEMDKQVKPNCDLIVDGSASIELVTTRIADAVSEHLKAGNS